MKDQLLDGEYLITKDYTDWVVKTGGYARDMTMRDHFAAKAMIGLMRMERAEQFIDENGDEMGNEEGDVGTLFVHTKFLAEEAYMIADAMLKERAK
jgi:hypothetical protein